MKTISEETRRRMSEAAKARCTDEWRAKKSAELATNLPAGEIAKLYESGMTQGQIAERFGVGEKAISNCLKRQGFVARKRGKRAVGSDNGNWKGDEATYSALHLRVIVARGQPNLCVSCNATEGCFEWANLTGKYQDVSDYIRLCRSCHRKLDVKRRRETGMETSKHVRRKQHEVS